MANQQTRYGSPWLRSSNLRPFSQTSASNATAIVNGCGGQQDLYKANKDLFASGLIPHSTTLEGDQQLGSNS